MLPEWTEEDLEDAVYGFVANEPDSSDKADRLAHALKRLTEERAANLALASRRVQRLTDWVIAQNEPLTGRIEWLEAALRNYLEAFKLRKFVNTDGVEVRLVTPRGHVEVRDPDSFMHWASHAYEQKDVPDDLVTLKDPVPDKRAIAQYLTKTPSSVNAGDQVEHQMHLAGEVVPGVYWAVPTQDKLTVKLPGAAEEKDEDA